MELAERRLEVISKGRTYTRRVCAAWLLSRLRVGRDLADLQHDAGDECCRKLAREVLAAPERSKGSE